ncbi:MULTISPECIES: DUF6434 domain-containing protein [unclassified Luteococcus]|uniref:DUF6434 domain-containing protein n=1 Tax=unclassified Luteococcus TaxID=2639923 RepID=UPI00313A9C77
MDAHDPRPSLTQDLTGDEFLRWYWLKDELIDFAHTLGIRATGSKALLTQRIAAALDGLPFDEPASPRVLVAAQLSGPLTGDTIIPRGQRCSQLVRAWFVAQVGEGFHFDAAMREFFAATDGNQTLNDALEHYRGTRDQGGTSIGEQFEYNRFTRAWHADRPGGSPDELLAAWQTYRSLPVDERDRI